MSRWARVLSVVGSVTLFIAYPLLVYVGATRLSGRGLALVLLAGATAMASVRAMRTRREHLAVALRIPAMVIGIALIGTIVDDRRVVMLLPVVVNLGLLAQFGSSLRSMPLVERFARMQEDSLSDAQVRYCRTVTRVWCAFFVANGGIALALALADAVVLWSLYTGVIGYLAMGTLGAIEYLVRKWRFRIFGDHLLDRALARAFGAREVASG